MNEVLDGGPDLPCKRVILRGERWPIVKYRDTAGSCAKTAERIEMLFGMWTWISPRKHILDGGAVGAHWRHLENTSESSMWGGDAAFLSKYFDQCCIYCHCGCYDISPNRPIYYCAL